MSTLYFHATAEDGTVHVIEARANNGVYYAWNPKLGCGKDYDTIGDAVFHLLDVNAIDPKTIVEEFQANAHVEEYNWSLLFWKP